MTRRLLFIAAAVAGAVLVVVLTLPWWFGAAARTVGGRYGLQLGEYQTVGYGRWQARDVVWSRDGVTVRVEQLEAGHPLGWLLRPGVRRATAGRWSVVVDEREPRPEAPDEGGWRPLIELINEIRLVLDQWLPEADVGPGEVRWPGGGLQLAGAQWRGGRLQVQRLEHQPVAADVTVAWPGMDARAVVEATGLQHPWRVEATVTPANVDARFEWHQQPGEVIAGFGPTGWLPEEAEVTASAWRLPGETMRLGATYAEVSGNVAASWREGTGWVRVHANGVPRVDAEVPPLRVLLEAAGNADQVTVRALEIFAPGVEAALEEPVTLDPRSQWAVNEATFRLRADLAELPGEGPAGRVEGHVRVEPRPGEWPRLRAELRADEVALAEWSGIEGAVTAVLEWPQLTVERAEGRDANGTEVSATGAIDLAARQVLRSEGQGQLAPESVARWLPDGIGFTVATFRASAEGPLQTLTHRGEAKVADTTVQRSQVLQLAANWTGQGLSAAAEATVATERGTAEIAARVQRDAVDVTALRIRQGDHELVRLTQPATVRWAPRWQVRDLRLAGPAVQLAAEVDDVAEGQLAVEAPRVSLLWLGDWWQDPLPVREVRNLQLRGDVVREVLHFTASGEVERLVANDERLVLGFRVRGDQRGMQVEQLTAAVAGESVIALEGRLPISLHPRGQPFLHVEPNGELVVNGRVAPSEEFWAAVAEASGVQVEAPQVELNLGGRWSKPTGAARIAAERIGFVGDRWKGRLPEVTKLQATFAGDGSGLVLEELVTLVEGQQVRAKGRVPLVPAEWAQLRAAPLDYLRQRGAAEIEIPGAELAALARLVPGYLAPIGQMRARLQFGPDGRIEGELALNGAVTRPLGPLGVLQEVQADLAFSGREMQVRTVQALMGGQPVRLSGTAALVENGPPRLDLRLQGQNLPLVRDTGMLLRADLDLTLTTNDRGDGRAAGNVRLRDSLFLAELEDFVPRGGGGGGSRPASRPPYFSVTIEPLNRWRLDVLVEGRDFLRLRTPVLEGTASARFQLTGTLGEPRAIGEALVEQGRVKLPFATFVIQEGAVRLTQADPFQPQVTLTGTTRRLGYELRMELTGTASDPRLQFFSSPPLPSEDIVLLVMAGQAPQEEVTYTGGQRAVQIGTFLGRGLIGDLFGGDGGDRLSVTSGERISRQGRETYNFMYELTPRLSLVGEYDEFDSYNAGIRWRLLPRRDRGDRREDDHAPGAE